MNFKKCIFLLLFVFAIVRSFSQQFFIKTYTIEDGLPTRNINDVCQDKEGIMWFATDYGISKYDGFSFTNYGIKDGIPNKAYRKIKIDEKGILWAMPERKFDTIIYFADTKWGKIIPLPKTGLNRPINSFAVSYKNNKPVICVGSYDGFYVYQDNAWTHFSISEKENSNYVYTVVARKKQFYLSTKIGICVFENNKLDWSLNKLINPYDKDIIAINFGNTDTPQEKLWILNEKWLGYIENNNFRMVNDKFQLPRPYVYYFSYVNCDTKGNVFFGNIWAKYHIPFSSNKLVPLMADNGFTSNGATSLFIDREQNIWFTDTRGINKINNLHITNYFKKSGMLEDEVTAITEMNDGRIVLGHNNGLSILKGNKFEIVEFPDLKVNTRRVGDMMKDRQGNIWFASISMGLGKLQPDNKITWIRSDKFPIINVVHQDKTGRIWVGADTKLLYLQDNELIEFSGYQNQAATIRKFFSDDKGGIYIASSIGLWHVHNNVTKRIPLTPDKKGDNVFSYLKSKEGIEFVGTMNGLYVIENDRLAKFQKNGIEINSPVFFIFQDPSGNYWIGTNKGVYTWDGERKIEVYNIYNGLSGWETNRAAGMYDSKGHVWVGTDRGLTCFEPDFNKTQIPVPEVRLMYVEDSKGFEYDLSAESSIKNADNTLTFQFRGISFFNEGLLEYKYKLEGFDQEWQDISQPMLGKVKYIGLKPGRYTFSVMARNFSGSWSEVSRSEPIKIEQPVYFRWWFLLAALIGLGGIFYGLIRINVQRLQNTRLEKEIIERKRIEQDLSESRQKFQDLVELLPETIYESDFSGRLIYLNDTGLKLFGYQHSDLNKDFLFDQLISPDCQDDIRQHMEIVFERKKSAKAIMTGISKKRITFPLSIHSVPVISKNKCIGTRGIIIDLTEQKRFEEQLQKNAEDLQVLNNSKDKFFSIIAHDLRSPFNTFLGFTEILDEELDTTPKEELHTIVTYLRNSAMNLYQLLDNLLEWALLHREITKFEPEKVLLLPLVQNCTSIVADSARLKDIEIKVKIPLYISVVADVHMLQTIIRNLLSNSVKFTPRGGSVIISASINEEHFVTLAVKDTGIGIQAEMLQKIFLFDANIKSKGTEGELSTGLGLILCKEFVEKHGGKIWVESEETKGSTFSFTIRSSQS